MNTDKCIVITTISVLLCFCILACSTKQEMVCFQTNDSYYEMKIPIDYQFVRFGGDHYEDNCDVYCYPNNSFNSLIYIFSMASRLDYSGVLIGELVYYCYGEDFFFHRYGEEPKINFWSNNDAKYNLLFGIVRPTNTHCFQSKPNYSYMTKEQIDSLFNAEFLIMGGYDSVFSWKEILIKDEIVVGYYNVPRNKERIFEKCLKSIRKR